MATMKLNDQAFKHAKSLIKSDDVARDTDWSEAQPSTDEENKFLEDEGRSEYAKWYLGYDPEEDKDNKSYYQYLRQLSGETVRVANANAAQGG